MCIVQFIFATGDFSPDYRGPVKRGAHCYMRYNISHIAMRTHYSKGVCYYRCLPHKTHLFSMLLCICHWCIHSGWHLSADKVVCKSENAQGGVHSHRKVNFIAICNTYGFRWVGRGRLHEFSNIEILLPGCL